MNTHAKDLALATAILDRIDPHRRRLSTFDVAPHARTLRRAQMTLHRWAELECGTDDGSGGTVSIERRDPGCRCTQCGHRAEGQQYANNGTPCPQCGDPAPLRIQGAAFLRHQRRDARGQWVDSQRVTPDREAGALRRVAAACKALGLSWYHQTDPRGCALYVDGKPLTHQNYPHGVACL